MEELDLKDLFSIFWNKKLEIIIITMVFMVVGIVYSYFFITPEYKVATTLILAQSSSTASQTGDSAITSTDLTMNSKLVSTYSEIIKKNSVLGQVGTNLNISEGELKSIKNKISVSSVNNTEIIEITVQNEDPNHAAEIANEIAKVFSEKIVEIYNISNIYILDKADPTITTSNINHAKDIVVFTFIGIVISAVYVLVANMLDNTIKTEQDIENITGLLVLSSIPNYDTEFKNRRGGKRE